MRPVIRALALLLILLPAAAHAAPAALADAEVLVRQQYAADADASAEMVAKLYVPEIVERMTSDEAFLNLGIDPRYGQDDWKVQDVQVSAEPGPGDTALVTARFLNFGKPARIDWRLIPAQDGPMGWKVQDISGPDQNDWAAFDMRALLRLPPAKP